MCAEIPQKVAAQKGAFKLSNKLFSILYESTEKPLRCKGTTFFLNMQEKSRKKTPSRAF